MIGGRLRAALAALAVVAALPVGGCVLGRVPAPPEAAVPIAPVSLQIGSFAGIPGNAGDRLSELVVEAAERRGIDVTRRRDLPSDYRLDGRLTAVGEVTGVIVSYSFFVIDAAGTAVHRIAGFEQAAGTGGDPWTDISDETLRLMAERAVAALAAWLARPAGT